MIPHALALGFELAATALAVAGMGYYLASLLAARVFLVQRKVAHPAFAPGVSILKSLKGLDPAMIDGFRSHCRQDYAGPYELLFGVASLSDPAVEAVRALQAEFPSHAIRLFECPETLGTNRKVGTLIQLAAHARYGHLLINDSDIAVGPRYLDRIMRCFAPLPADAARPPVGMVTALYRGRAHGSLFGGGLPSRLEMLGIATDFQAGVLLSKAIEGGLSYGLGSTLAVSREALEKAGGLIAVADYLADDYELGHRIAQAGYRVELSAEVVETGVPAYGWRGFFDHQVRWLRAVRESRPAGYAGMIFMHGFAWAIVNALVSGFRPFSLWLLALGLVIRTAQAVVVGAGVLGDRQVLPNLWLIPLRDLVALGLWFAGFVGNTIVWRGEQFALKAGKLVKLPRG